jgi:hypothetical protein
MNVLNEVRKVVHGDAIIADMGRDDVGGKCQQHVFGSFIVGHRQIPELSEQRSRAAMRTENATSWPNSEAQVLPKK